MQHLKCAVRKKMQYLLSDIDSREKHYWSTKLSQRLQKLFLRFAFHKKIIGAFAPLDDEPFWPRALGGDWQTVFPVEIEGGMIFKKSSYSDLISQRMFGTQMLAPPQGAPAVVPEVLLVPGYAFTAQCERLGRGGGFYDKYSEAFSGWTIGLCWENQILPTLPCEDHDISMDCVVTNESIYYRRPQRDFLKRR